jgi:hypothetical protein
MVYLFDFGLVFGKGIHKLRQALIDFEENIDPDAIIGGIEKTATVLFTVFGDFFSMMFQPTS